MESREIEVIIDTEEIAQYLFKNLILEGFAPTEHECEILSEIVFDFLLEKSFIDEDMIEDYED